MTSNIDTMAAEYAGGRDELERHLAAIEVPFECFLAAKRANQLLARLVRSSVSIPENASAHEWREAFTRWLERVRARHRVERFD